MPKTVEANDALCASELTPMPPPDIDARIKASPAQCRRRPEGLHRKISGECGSSNKRSQRNAVQHTSCHDGPAISAFHALCLFGLFGCDLLSTVKKKIAGAVTFAHNIGLHN